VSTIPSVSYSITVRLEVPAGGAAVSQLTTAVEQAGGAITALDVTASGHERLQIDVTCAARDTAHADELVEAMRGVAGVAIGKVSDRTFLMHLGGKIAMNSKHPIRNRDDLSMVYTPGVARVCLAIAKNKEDARRLTIKRNSIAVISDGSAVLGLGNIGPEAAMPVMEGKAALFKRFADIDAWPLCLDTQDTEEIISVVRAVAPGFAGINLEDISAPRCFEIEARLRGMLDIPVFHDDQHGTAIVVVAALYNALRVVDKKIGQVKVVMAGAGAAGDRHHQAAPGCRRPGHRGGRHRRCGAPGSGRTGRRAGVASPAHQPARCHRLAQGCGGGRRRLHRRLRAGGPQRGGRGQDG
jgi:malate dehydrogenase (oxaloacetate-decarboxylating)